MSESDNESSGPPHQTLIPSNLEPDQDRDPEYDDETESLDENITNYVREYGRTYHRYKEGSYPYPNDPREQERWDTQYDLLKWLFRGTLHFAPISDKPDAILDLGTGTGRWAIEMGEKYPTTRVTGTDLAPTQPKHVPPNVYFDIEDYNEDEWLRDPGSFDLIHAQLLIGGQGSSKRVIRNAYQYLKPEHGWLEWIELDPVVRCDDGTIPPNWAFTEWLDYLFEASEELYEFPRPLRFAPRIAGWMRASGYGDVREQIYKLPLSPWPSDPAFKELGRRWQNNFLEAFPALTYKLFGSDGLRWNRHEIEVYLVEVRKAIKDRSCHAYQNLHVVYGRRPTREEEQEIRKQAEQRRQLKEAKRRGEAAGHADPAAATSSHTGPASAQVG